MLKLKGELTKDYPMPIKIISKKKWRMLVAQEAMEVVEQMANEMGAEIHDDLMHRLAIFKFFFERMDKEMHDPEAMLTLAAEMKMDFKDIIESVRRVSKQLFPAHMGQKTFTQSIHLLSLSMERPGMGHIHFSSDGHERAIAYQSEAYISRIVQELIHNAFKHSSAWHVWVKMHWTPERLIVEVEDDGTGFMETKDAIAKLNAKYNTLRMRADAINAKISYSTGDKGLRATLQYEIK